MVDSHAFGAGRLRLHALGVFHWYYWWWNVATFPVIVVLGYLTFYVVAFIVYDARRRSQQIAIVALLRRLTWAWALSSDRCSAGSKYE